MGQKGRGTMPQIPRAVVEADPPLEGLQLRGRGKVRDTYDLEGHPDLMLVVASDRVSIFDFVIDALIGDKGAILNAMSHFWTTGILQNICPTDFVAAGAKVDYYLPANLRDDPDVQSRATVVRRFPPPNVEDIVRIHLTGSGHKAYQATGSVCGHKLPQGLKDGSRLPYPIYTPTTKAPEGHDEHIDADGVATRFGHKRERLALQCAMAAAEFAAQRGIIVADTKLEFTVDAHGNLVLVDERITPDSSRFWAKSAWEKAMAKGGLPPAFDKQYVREWGKLLGIDSRDPRNPEHVAYVQAQEVPKSVRDMTTRLYRYIFWRLTGLRLEHYLLDHMRVNVEPPARRITVIIGSQSDENQILEGVGFLRNNGAVGSVNVLSCHRNPTELEAFLDKTFKHSGNNEDVVIAGAGKAAQLPGIVKGLLCAMGLEHIPVIGVAFKGETPEDNRDATGSIKGLPGQPVELDPNGEAYFGSEGFAAACRLALDGEFRVRRFDPKPPQLNLYKFS